MRRGLLIVSFICVAYQIILVFSLINRFEPIQTWASGYLFLSKEEIPSDVHISIHEFPVMGIGSGAYHKGELVGVYGRMGELIPVKKMEDGRYILDDASTDRNMNLIGIIGLISALVLVGILTWSLIDRRLRNARRARLNVAL